MPLYIYDSRAGLLLAAFAAFNTAFHGECHIIMMTAGFRYHMYIPNHSYTTISRGCDLLHTAAVPPVFEDLLLHVHCRPLHHQYPKIYYWMVVG